MLRYFLTILFWSLSFASFASEPREINIFIGLVWSGDPIQSQNWKEAANLRQNFKSLDWLHFISPSYFLRNDPISSIGDLVYPGDTVGVHIQPRKSIIEKAGIPFHKEPTIFGRKLFADICQKEDCGKEVLLSAYSADELKKIFEVSLNALTDYGFPRPKIFTTSGYEFANSINESAAHNHLIADFSFPATQVMKSDLSFFPLDKSLRSFFSDKVKNQQSYKVSTPKNPLTIVTRNIGLIEFSSLDDMQKRMDEHLNSANDKEFICVIVNLETIFDNAHRLRVVLEHLLKRIEEKNLTIADPKNIESNVIIAP